MDDLLIANSKYCRAFAVQKNSRAYFQMKKLGFFRKLPCIQSAPDILEKTALETCFTVTDGVSKKN